MTWFTGQGLRACCCTETSCLNGKNGMTSICISPWMEPMIPTGNTISGLFPRWLIRTRRLRMKTPMRLCVAPIMIKFTQPALTKLGYQPHQIIMSLENRMKCGIGMCGRCNIGKELVCKDGPVFTLEEINQTRKNIENQRFGGLFLCFSHDSFVTAQAAEICLDFNY